MNKEQHSTSPDNQKENGRDDTKKKEINQKQSKDDSFSEEQLLEFYKEKCERLRTEIDKHKEKCSELETDNFELTSKIDELKAIVKESIEIKTQFEEMGIDLDELLDKIDESE